jgi:catechol 2,3-dioxygenase-like lactoylglutathione lyase family enzyme
MTEPIANERPLHSWYARPVLFVSDVPAALRFYVDQLGFEKKWHAGDGKGTVCQVNRGDCEIILCQDAARRDRSRLFVELNPRQLAELRRLITERSLSFDKTWWGYDTIRIADPDGNELFFPVEES